jgi:hypothetical protein
VERGRKYRSAVRWSSYAKTAVGLVALLALVAVPALARNNVVRHGHFHPGVAGTVGVVGVIGALAVASDFVRRRR